MFKLGYAIFFILLANSIYASACSCIANPGVLESLSNSDYVFTGKVIEVDEKLIDNLERKVTFETETFWKGSIKERIEVRTNFDSASCGYPFVENKEYLVYAIFSSDNVLRTTICSRTNVIEYAQEDLAMLGTGRAFYEDLEIESNPERSLRENVAIGLFAVAVLLFVLFGIKKRRLNKSD